MCRTNIVAAGSQCAAVGTRWTPPAFLPPTDDPGRRLINLEELPSAMQMQTTARYAHLARDSIQTAAARITGSIGGNLLAEPTERVDQPGD